jgi:CHAT domain-containing protein
MHTIMNDSLPMFSKLVFASTPDSSNDGFLNTQEIYNMKLNARLVVLSACNTGSGKMRTGEGVMSMARAFLYAGCPSIVMTLWEVEDKSSATLVLDFYRYLFKGYSKPEALRLAKLEYLTNADPFKSHPYFWMGYIVIGDPSPIKYHTTVMSLMLAFAFIASIVLIFWKRIFKMIWDKEKKSEN